MACKHVGASSTLVQFSKYNPYDRSEAYKIIRMAFICTVKAPMHHCSNITHISLYNTKNAIAKTDQTN